MIRAAAAVAASLLLLLPGLGAARTLEVGPGKAFELPSAAIAAAQDGDTVQIDSGTYFDCAIVRRNRLTIAGPGAGAEQPAVITDKTCEGKALLVISGDQVTVQDLTLARARVPDGNGAGIRLEAPRLTLQRVSFENDSVALLSGSSGGEIRVEHCRFRGGGAGGERPLFAVLVGSSALLQVTDSEFADVAGGQINSAANHTDIVGNSIATGSGELPAFAVQVSAGDVLVADNTITVGPHRPRRDAAIALLDDATGTIRNNRLVNRTGKRMALLLDWSWGDPVLERNQIGPEDEDVTSAGLWRHRAANEFYARKAQARALAGLLKRFVQGHLLP